MSIYRNRKLLDAAKDAPRCMGCGRHNDVVVVVDNSIMQAVADQLASAMAAKTDAVLQEAITRFLGSDDWTLDELQGRGVMQHWPSGIDVFCLDGVALVELLPITVHDEHKGGSVVLHATRQHRFLVFESGKAVVA